MVTFDGTWSFSQAGILAQEQLSQLEDYYSWDREPMGVALNE